VGDILEFFSDVLGNRFLKVNSELVDIVEVDHSIFENSLAFMNPKANYLLGFSFVVVRLTLHDSFNDFRKVSKIELVVEFLSRRRISGILENSIENMDSSIN